MVASMPLPEMVMDKNVSGRLGCVVSYPASLVPRLNILTVKRQEIQRRACDLY
jgi:hypothetical protein